MLTRLSVAAFTATVLLSGCGTHLATPAAQAPHAMSAFAKKKAVAAPAKVDEKAFAAGLARGLARFADDRKQGLTQDDQAPAGVDKFAFDYGYVTGLLQGSIAAYSRIDGSFDVYQWKSFAYLAFGAMKDAKGAIDANPELLAKFGMTAGILAGGIQSFSSVDGSFDVHQWMSFANTNYGVLKQALGSLKQ